MPLTFEAIYENGVLKPVEPLPLQEHDKVWLTLQTPASWVEETRGIIGWEGDPEALRRLALAPEFDLEEEP